MHNQRRGCPILARPLRRVGTKLIAQWALPLTPPVPQAGVRKKRSNLGPRKAELHNARSSASHFPRSVSGVAPVISVNVKDEHAGCATSRAFREVAVGQPTSPPLGRDALSSYFFANNT
jgi:hypothetical protein